MDILIYFIFGLLNIGLLYLIAGAYKKVSDVDLFPGRGSGDKVEIITSLGAYFFCGPFGTAMLILMSIFLFLMWRRYYKNK